MAHKTDTRTLEDLDLILEEERSALLAGDLSRIASLTSEKEHLIGALNALIGPSADDLTILQDKLTRNQALLDGTLQGIRTVAARLAAHRRIRRSMDTYDQHGRKFSIPGDAANNIEKRA
ncbi:flagellar protein FlgN [Roseovarius sp.]|uniref:flagellar protein FlgN n=1 Tax=Roseovarius sp. TaxID=1486281 RepID=UPI003A97A3CE